MAGGERTSSPSQRTIRNVELQRLWHKTNLLNPNGTATTHGPGKQRPRRPGTISKLLTTTASRLNQRSIQRNDTPNIRQQLLATFTNKTFGEIKEKSKSWINASQRMLQTQNGFYFQQRHGKIDLRAIVRLNLAQVVEDVDVDTLQKHIENLTFARLDQSDLLNHSDESFLKLFQLMQLTLEYLLNVQSTLYSYSTSLETQVSLLEREHKVAHAKLDDQDQTLTALKTELSEKRRVLQTYEFLLMKQSVPRIQQVSPSVPNKNHEESKEHLETVNHNFHDILQREVEAVKVELEQKVNERLSAKEAELLEKSKQLDALHQQLNIEMVEQLNNMKHELSVQHDNQKSGATLAYRGKNKSSGEPSLLDGFKESFAGDLMNDDSDDENVNTNLNDTQSTPLVQELRNRLKQEKEAKFLLLSQQVNNQVTETTNEASISTSTVQQVQDLTNHPQTPKIHKLMDQIADGSIISKNNTTSRNRQLRRLVSIMKRRLESKAFQHWVRSDAILKTTQQVESQYFKPSYEWSPLPEALRHSGAEGLEVKYGKPNLCRIPFSWVAVIKVQGGQSGRSSIGSVRVRVSRTESIDEVRQRIENEIQLRQANLCCVLRDEADDQIISNVDTVETSELFHRKLVAHVTTVTNANLPSPPEFNAELFFPKDRSSSKHSVSSSAMQRQNKHSFVDDITGHQSDESSRTDFSEASSGSSYSHYSNDASARRSQHTRVQLQAIVDEEMKQRGFRRTTRSKVQSPVQHSMEQLEGTIDSILEASENEPGVSRRNADAQKPRKQNFKHRRKTNKVVATSPASEYGSETSSWKSSNSERSFASSQSSDQNNEESPPREKTRVKVVQKKKEPTSSEYTKKSRSSKRTNDYSNAQETEVARGEHGDNNNGKESNNDVNPSSKSKVNANDTENDSVAVKTKNANEIKEGIDTTRVQQKKYSYHDLQDRILQQYLSSATDQLKQRETTVEGVIRDVHHDVIASLLSGKALQSVESISFVASVDSGSSRSDTSQSAHSGRSSAYDSDSFSVLSGDSFASPSSRDTSASPVKRRDKTSKLGEEGTNAQLSEFEQPDLQGSKEATESVQQDKSVVETTAQSESDDGSEGELDELEDSLEYSAESHGLDPSNSPARKTKDEEDMEQPEFLNEVESDSQIDEYSTDDVEDSFVDENSGDDENLSSYDKQISEQSDRSITPPLVGGQRPVKVEEPTTFLEDLDDLAEEFGI